MKLTEKIKKLSDLVTLFEDKNAELLIIRQSNGLARANCLKIVQGSEKS